jgi:hypothetical protein
MPGRQMGLNMPRPSSARNQKIGSMGFPEGMRIQVMGASGAGLCHIFKPLNSAVHLFGFVPVNPIAPQIYMRYILTSNR